jgi:hypothetical protein
MVFVPLAPVLWVLGLYVMRTGHDLYSLYIVGSVVFFLLGLVSVIVGLGRRRADYTLSGSVALAAVVLTMLLAGNVLTWRGTHIAVLRVRVVDAQSRKPVAGATVIVFDRFDPDLASHGNTDENGMSLISHSFSADGSESVVARTAWLSLSGVEIKISGPGYHPRQILLAQYVGDDSVDCYGAGIPPVELEISRKNAE